MIETTSLPAELAAALARMAALLDPALDLLTAGPDSATAKGSRDDMRTIRDALADRASPSRAATVTLTALNLRNALDFVAPDFEVDEDQRESEVTIGWAPDRMSIDNEPLAAGYYCWLTDYPEEGAIPLDQGEWSSAAVDVGAAQAETAQAAPALVDLLMDAEEANHIERAAGLLEGYVQFIKDHVMSADIEMHPYLPEIEDAAQELRSIVSRIGEFTPTSDYLFGHADGLEWAAQVVEANDPRTGDWLHDDRSDLANALRKGPELPAAAAQAAPVVPASELSELQRLSACCPELNLSNYTADDVDELNGWAIEVAQCIDRAATQGATHGN